MIYFFSPGIKFVFDSNIVKFEAKEADESVVGTVVLNNGEILNADIVIIGIGSTFYTNWIKDSPIETLEDGSIVVDKVY